MRTLRTAAIFLSFLMVVSSFTIIAPLASDTFQIVKPRDKIHDSLLPKTSSSDEVDVLVGYDDLTELQLQNAKSFTEKYADVIEVYGELNMMRIRIIGTSLLELAKNALISSIWPNEALGVKPLKSSSRSILADDEYESIAELVGAKDLWEMGYNGSGIVLAVLDTGVDSGHPDLDDFDDNSSTSDTKVAAYASFVEADALPTDILGSGTYAATVAAGTGNASDGRYSGIAPGATLLAGKVTLGGLLALPSWIVSGIEWASTNGADIILLPFNTFGAPNDAVEQAVRATVEKGIFVVAAAGDDGPDYLTIMSPGGGLEAFTVGAYDTTNQEVPAFSGRGPSLAMNTKPDLVAPGVGIVGARIGAGLGGLGLGGIDIGGLLGGLSGGEDTSVNIDDYYKASDTTAAAAAVVAGAAALLMEAFDRATPIVVGNVLRDTATVLPYGANDAGAGLLNLPAAFRYLSRRQNPIEPHSRTTGSALLAFGFLSASGNNASTILMMSSYGTSTLVMDSRGGSMDIHMLMGTLYLKWNDMDPTSLMSFNVKREMHSVTLAGLTGLLGGLGGLGDTGDLGGLGGLGDLGGLMGLLGGGAEDTGYGRWIGVLSYDDTLFVTLVVESYNFTVNSTLPLTAYKITPFILNMGQSPIDNVSLYLSYSLTLFGDEEDDHGKYDLNNQQLFAYGISEDYRDFYIGINSSRKLDAFEVGNASDISSHITDDNLTGSTNFDGEVGLGMKWDFGRIYPDNPVNVSIAMGFGENRTVLNTAIDAMWKARPPSSYAGQGDFLLVEAEIPRTAQTGETYESQAILMNVGIPTSDSLAAMLVINDNNGTGSVFAEYFTFEQIKPFHAEVVHSEWRPEENGIHQGMWISTVGIETLTSIISNLNIGAITSLIIGIMDDSVSRDIFVVEPIISASVFPKTLPYAPFDVRFPTDFGMYTIMLATTLDLGNMTVRNEGSASDWGNATLTPADSVTGIYNFSLFILVPPIGMDGYHRCDYVLETEHGWTANVTLKRVIEYPRAIVMLDTAHGGGFGSLLGGSGGFDIDLGMGMGNDTGGGLPFPLAQDDIGGLDTSGLGGMGDLGDISSLFDSIRMTTFSALSNMEKKLAEKGIQILEIPGMALDETLLSQAAAILTIAPTEKFNQSEIDTIRDYTADGGKLIVLGDSNERSNLTILNSLLIEYGYFMAGEHTEENTTEIVSGSLLGTGVDSMWLGGGTYIYNNQSQASVRLNDRTVALLDKSSPEITIFGSSRIFMNKNLEKCNNSIVLDNLIEYLLDNTLTCVTSLAENTTLYKAGKSVYINLDVTDYYGHPVNDLTVAVAFELPDGNLSFFIAGFVENGLYSTQFTPSYWSKEGTINAIFIVLRDEFAGTYASISFEFYEPDAPATTSDLEPLLTLVQVAYLTSFGIFGALLLSLYSSRKRRGKHYRIPEIDIVLGHDIDNTLNMLQATMNIMNDLMNRDDVDKIQKIEAMRSIMEDVERAQKQFEDVSDRIGGF